MIKKNNRKCICCQKEYSFCPNCSDYDNLPRWMTIFHDENCKEIFNTVTSYYDKSITKDKAKERLDKCDLSNKYTFKESIKSAIGEIYAKTLVEVVEKEVEKETVKETETEFVELQENTEEFIAEEKIVRKKKNYKKNIELIDEE